MERVVRWLGIGLSAVLFFLPYEVCGQSPYYQGKTITMVQGREPGGAGDLRNKVLFPFLQKYIPGNPVIVSEYMPGGGGRKAANFVYRVRSDGLTMGASSPGLLASAVLEATGIDFDFQKFIYLGSPWSANNNIFSTRKAAGFDSLEKLQRSVGFRIGAQSVGHVQYIRGRLFAWLLDLKEPKFVLGIAGAELDLAMERGEIDGRADSIDNIMSGPLEYQRKLKDFHSILEIPLGHRPPQFADLPEIAAFARTPSEKQVLTMSRGFWGVGTLIFLPPSTPEKLAEILRQAFRSTY
ncbi:MAG TPA: hypothetical protein VLA17_01725, partial [Candidatus Limnocylindria bacterium]|nr:hypothetical protein [Candidatus Limnocylindria bacterium]